MLGVDQFSTWNALQVSAQLTHTDHGRCLQHGCRDQAPCWGADVNPAPHGSGQWWEPQAFHGLRNWVSRLCTCCARRRRHAHALPRAVRQALQEAPALGLTLRTESQAPPCRRHSLRHPQLRPSLPLPVIPGQASGPACQPLRRLRVTKRLVPRHPRIQTYGGRCGLAMSSAPDTGKPLTRACISTGYPRRASSSPVGASQRVGAQCGGDPELVAQRGQ